MLTKIHDFSRSNGFILYFEFQINSLPIDRFVFYLANELAFQFGLNSNAGLSVNYGGTFLPKYNAVNPAFWYKAIFIVTLTDKTEV